MNFKSRKCEENGKKVLRYSIRKHHLGVASVAVASVLFFATGVTTVQADGPGATGGSATTGATGGSAATGATGGSATTGPTGGSATTGTSDGAGATGPTGGADTPEPPAADNTTNSVPTSTSTRESSHTRNRRELKNNYNGTVTFVTNHGNTDVKFTGEDETLDHTDVDGNKANTGDSGGGRTKAYFQGFSNVKYYDGSDGQIMVYKNEPIKNLFPEGLKGGEKVYAVYLSSATVLGLNSHLTGKLEINKNISSEETAYNKINVKNNTESKDKREITYYVGEETVNNLKFGASFSLDPFATAVVRYSPSHYFQPGTAEHYPTTDADKLADPTNKDYTYVDLHVQLDKRIKLADELDFDLKSYSFQPHMILDKNKNKIAATFEISKDTPNSKVKFNTRDLIDNEFILRTRIRRIENMQENVPLATASSDMELISNKDDNFSVSKEEILKIAKKETKPLEINGYIDGWAKLYGPISFWGFSLGGPQAIPKTRGKLVSLNFEFNKVSFNKNTNQYNDDSEQDLGTVNVEHNKAIQTDELKDGIKPTKEVVGDTMPDNLEDITLTGKVYKFKEWNTKADGSGTVFTGETKITEDITVYAIWKEKINVIPIPTPQPAPQPEPQPNPQPTPQPTPQPEPQPDSQPNPQPVPQPTPTPSENWNQGSIGVNKQDELPQTGSQQDEWLVALGGLSILGALTVFPKKREE
ncbi:YSIRK-type signal peptide-containing protein [Streptococcus pneumoniae]|uniref:YSIRK-type signal peptide-containing protein n=1 Tax=Streptococcus pseudopneumoniae TaxID=257758 RepID=UPI003128ED58